MGLVLNFSQQESLCKTSDMALKIRLTKVGSVHQPLYRVVVAEARSRRDGAAVENLGTYRPGDKGNPINLNMERVEYWLSKGALPTNTMHAMIKKARRAAGAKAEAPAASA
jgi:small subunit ribosomal protein S16